jgi:hypothetical protein
MKTMIIQGYYLFIYLCIYPAPKAAKQATDSPGSCSIQELPPE